MARKKSPEGTDSPFRMRTRFERFLIWTGFKRPPENEVAQAYMLNLLRDTHK